MKQDDTVMVLGSSLVLASLIASPGSRYATVNAYLEASRVAPNHEVWLALQVTLEDGFHTYWTNPGDGGLRTEVVLDLPKGWSAKPTQFPTPSRIEKDGTVAFGYDNSVTFLKQLVAPPAGEGKVTINGTLVMAVCKDSCMPATQSFSVSVDLGKTMKRIDKNVDRLMAAFRQLPTSSSGMGRYRALDDRVLIQVPRHPQLTASSFEVMASEPGILATQSPVLRAQSVNNVLQLELKKADPFESTNSPFYVLVVPTDASGKRLGNGFLTFTGLSKDLAFAPAPNF